MNSGAEWKLDTFDQPSNISQTQSSTEYKHLLIEFVTFRAGNELMIVTRLGISNNANSANRQHHLNFSAYRSRNDIRHSMSHRNDVPSNISQAHASLLPCLYPTTHHPTTTSVKPTIHQPTSPILQHPLAHSASTTIPFPDSRPTPSRPPSAPTLHPPNFHLAHIPLQTRRLPRSQNLRYLIRDSVDATLHQDGTVSRRD